jgi:hypothetical protein
VIFAVPLYDDNPTKRAPAATWFLIGFCTGAFLWKLGHNQRAILYLYGMIPAVLFGSAHLVPALGAVPPWATLADQHVSARRLVSLDRQHDFFGSSGTISKIASAAAATSCSICAPTSPQR